MKNKLFQLAIENEENNTSVTGSNQKEQEITIYAKIGNPAGLEKAYSVEEHLQAEIKIDDKKRMRVRKTTTSKGEELYQLTTKQLCGTEESVRSFIEKTYDITSEVFNAFLTIVPSFQHKKRYGFHIEKMKVESGDKQKFLDVNDFKYEVDVYLNKDKQPSTWCKIDVEIQNLEQQMVDLGFDIDSFNVNISASKLPFEPSEFILMDENTSEENKAKVSELYETQFLIFNTN